MDANGREKKEGRRRVACGAWAKQGPRLAAVMERGDRVSQARVRETGVGSQP